MIGKELDERLYELNTKISLLADALGFTFEYDWDGVSGIKKREQECES